MKFFQESYLFSSNPTLPYRTNYWAAQAKLPLLLWEGRQVSAQKDGRKKQENGNQMCWDLALIHQGAQQVPGKEPGSFCNSNSSSRTLSFCAGQAGPVAISTFQPQHCCPRQPCAVCACSRPVPSCSRAVAESQTCSYSFCQKRKNVTKTANASQKMHFCLFFFDT